MKKVFVTAHLPGNAFESLKMEYDVEVFPDKCTPTSSQLHDGAMGSEALITMVTDRVDKAIIDACPGLKIISNCGVGYENIDISYATEKGILVTNTPGVLTETTADLAWALIFAVARRITEADSFVRKGEFRAWDPSLMMGVNVYGKTLGIYGMGRIGSAVARRSEGFDMRVIYNNRNRNKKAEEQTGAQYIDFESLLKESDFLVITAPLNEETQGRFGLKEFRKMRGNSILINIGRGSIVREKELASALKERIIWGAGLDVYEKEPYIEKVLIELKNVVLLPHIGSASRQTRERMAEMAVESVRSVLNGKVPPNIANPEVLRLVK